MIRPQKVTVLPLGNLTTGNADLSSLLHVCTYSPEAQMVKKLPAMQDTQIWPLGWGDPLEEGMATHSSILAWRIPWTGEPGRLQSMGSHRVGHDWVIEHMGIWVSLWLSGKESSCQYRKPGSIPGSGKSHWDESGNPVQYSFLENSTDWSLADYSPWGHKSGTWLSY